MYTWEIWHHYVNSLTRPYCINSEYWFKRLTRSYTSAHGELFGNIIICSMTKSCCSTNPWWKWWKELKETAFITRVHRRHKDRLVFTDNTSGKWFFSCDLYSDTSLYVPQTGTYISGWIWVGGMRKVVCKKKKKRNSAIFTLLFQFYIF